MPQIHPLASVHPAAVLADDVVVGPFAVIEANVQIGAGSIILNGATVADGARLGREVKVSPGAVLSTAPQDLKYGGEPTELHVGDRTVIREGATLNRGTTASGITSVGADCLIMAYTHVGHDCRLGDGVILSNAVQLAGHVDLDDFVRIGGLTGCHQFTRIGRYTMVGGGYRVAKDVPPFILTGREPLAFAGLNVILLRRSGFSAEVIAALDETYRLIYRAGLNVSQGIAAIRERPELTDVPEVAYAVEFIASSKRGIIRG